jgi:hypothetical protein
VLKARLFADRFHRLGSRKGHGWILVLPRETPRWYGTWGAAMWALNAWSGRRFASRVIVWDLAEGESYSVQASMFD